MGILTAIEEKIGSLVERPFKSAAGVDLPGIEIGIKKLIEKRKKNILGRIMVPNVYTVLLKENIYEEYEPFLGKFEESICISLQHWLREKGYEIPGVLSIEFCKGQICNGSSFRVLIPRSDSCQPKPFIIGELVCSRSSISYKIKSGSCLLGRSDCCDVMLHDHTVSYQHARLSVIAGKILIEDLGSRNGTRVNHRKIGRAWLKSGDKILLGESELLFRSDYGNSD
jgi:hypothetical protein